MPFKVNSCCNTPHFKETCSNVSSVILGVALLALSAVAVVSMCTSQAWGRTPFLDQYYAVFLVSAGFAIGSLFIIYPFIKQKN
jgi:hypothetical protein